MSTKPAFIASVTQELVRARTQVGLSQAEVAARMQTGQSQISRMEHNKKGAFSLHTIADYALACGYIPCSFDADGPLSFHLIPVEEAREFILADVKKPLTWKNYLDWKTLRVLATMEPAGNTYVPRQKLSSNPTGKDASAPAHTLSCNSGKVRIVP